MNRSTVASTAASSPVWWPAGDEEAGSARAVPVANSVIARPTSIVRLMLHSIEAAEGQSDQAGGERKAPRRRAQRSTTTAATVLDTISNSELSGPNIPPVSQSGPA